LPYLNVAVARYYFAATTTTARAAAARTFRASAAAVTSSGGVLCVRAGGPVRRPATSAAGRPFKSVGRAACERSVDRRRGQTGRRRIASHRIGPRALAPHNVDDVVAMAMAAAAAARRRRRHR